MQQLTILKKNGKWIAFTFVIVLLVSVAWLGYREHRADRDAEAANFAYGIEKQVSGPEAQSKEQLEKALTQTKAAEKKWGATPNLISAKWAWVQAILSAGFSQDASFRDEMNLFLKTQSNEGSNAEDRAFAQLFYGKFLLAEGNLPEAAQYLEKASAHAKLETVLSEAKYWQIVVAQQMKKPEGEVKPLIAQLKSIPQSEYWVRKVLTQ